MPAKGEMRRQVRWLHGELGGWVRRGLIEPGQAEAIRGLYPRPGEGLPWGAIIFLGLGAVVVGLGVVLLFAYNWQAMPKALKLGVVFLSLAASQAGGAWLFLRRERLRALGEGLLVLSTMLFGAGIWLVAQIYHIDEHFPNGFLVWGLGALAMAWALPSIPQGIIAAALLAIWGGTEALGFGQPVHVAPLLAASVAGLALVLRSPVLLAAAIPAAGLCAGFNAGRLDEELAVGVTLSASAFLVAAAVLARRSERFRGMWPVLAGYGWAGYTIILYLLTFPDVSREWMGGAWTLFRDRREPAEAVYQFVALALCLGGWARVAWPLRPGSAAPRPTDVPLHLWLVPLTAGAVQLFQLAPQADVKWAYAGAFCLVFLGHAAGFMARGIRAGGLGCTIAGAVFVVALATARFFDLFESLAARGAVFVMVGGVLIAEGILYTRARKDLARPPSGALEA